MVLTNQFHLPTEEELTVPELNVTASAFATGAFHLGKYCEEPCKVSWFVFSLISRSKSPVTLRLHVCLYVIVPVKC